MDRISLNVFSKCHKVKIAAFVFLPTLLLPVLTLAQSSHVWNGGVVTIIDAERENYINGTEGGEIGDDDVSEHLEIEFNHQPNVIVILADDLGYGDLGVYGQDKIRTPNLDRMARDGILFTDFYSGGPHCPAARATLMTGQHTGHTGMSHYPYNSWLPRDDIPMLPKYLQLAGYKTGMFGKWGMSDSFNNGFPEYLAPAIVGFDEFLGFLTHRDAHAYYLDSPGNTDDSTPEHPNYHEWTIRQYLYTIQDGHLVTQTIPSDQYTHDEFINQALNFIDSHKNSPFFLYLPLTIPHAELVVPNDSLNCQDAPPYGRG